MCEELICPVITRAEEVFHLKSAGQAQPSGDEGEAPHRPPRVRLKLNLKQMKTGPLLHSDALRERHRDPAGVRFVGPETGAEVIKDRIDSVNSLAGAG